MTRSAEMAPAGLRYDEEEREELERAGKAGTGGRFR